jgi:hypothetical protein
MRLAMRAHVHALLVVAAFALGCGRSNIDDDDLVFPPGEGSSGAASGGTSTAMNEAGVGPGDDAGELDQSVPSRSDSGAGETEPDASSPPPGPCGPFTCPDGCCLNGSCFVATVGADGVFPVDIPCGSNGEECATCPSGDTCLGGGCQRDLGQLCTPENCAGCCLLAAGDNGSGSTQCFVGTQDRFCGSGAGQCSSCTPGTNGGHCAPSSPGGGHCEDVGECNATNCAGCCSGKLCVVGSQDVGCGTHGVACQDCTSDGGVCVGVGLPDGGTQAACGYDCQPGLPLCTVICPSVSDCAPIAGGPPLPASALTVP